MLLAFHILLSVSLFAVGMGLGGMIEFRRFRTELLEPYASLVVKLARLEKDLRILAEDIHSVGEEVEDINSTREIPIMFDDDQQPHHTMEIIDYDPDQYAD